ncbi:SBBP repeat-containing protein [Pseudotenacibaculum haliotis]|uniref:SBBP repeat-containing protein n=1 Tax=Pseudotenacibaculum haliotis TaxID=1862138 RepID=A0ABW5LRD6_9FLAO
MKQLLITLTIFLTFFNSQLHGQKPSPSVIYSTYYGGIGTDDADVLTIDTDGNTYLGCHSSSRYLPGADQFPYKLSGGMDAFVIKLNNKGSKVSYLTKLGGSKWDAIQGLVSDSTGNIYAVGTTYSSDFPVNQSGFQSNFGGKSDAFVVKINPQGKVIWSTLLGGSKDEDGRDIIIGSQGNIHVIGRTASKDFPTSSGALQSKSSGGIDAFICTFNPDGNLLSSTYLGGSGDDIGFSIKSDDLGQLYVAGTTNSIDFPIKNAIQSKHNGSDDVFLAIIDQIGSQISFSSYLGGAGTERLYSIDLDSLGNVFVMGVTNSLNYPTTKGSFQTNFGGARDAFITKLNLQKKEVLYSTYLGGSKDDDPRNLVIDNKGNSFIVGETSSHDFPLVNNIQKNHFPRKQDAFITMLDVHGSFLHFSTLFGGNGTDVFEGVTLGLDGTLTLSGASNSTDFPTTNPIQNVFSGGRFDMIVTRISIFTD